MFQRRGEEEIAKQTLCIDWDGTLVEGKWPDDGDWMPGAVNFLRRYQDKYRIVISTCRTNTIHPSGDRRDPGLVFVEKEKIRKKLDDEGLTTVELWDYTLTPWKPYAVAYIDDRAVKYPGRSGSWLALEERIDALG